MRKQWTAANSGRARCKTFRRNSNTQQSFVFLGICNQRPTQPQRAKYDENGDDHVHSRLLMLGPTLFGACLTRISGIFPHDNNVVRACPPTL